MSQEQSPNPQQGNDAPARKHAPAWAIGGVLIAVGIIFILKNVSGFTLNNWWALFILIPALGSLATAFQMWERNDRRFTVASRGPLIGGLVLLGVTAVFLFNIDWGKVWPLFLILVGLGVMAGAFERKN
jgi:hypothetical protein